MGYQKERDQVADQQWQKEYDFAMQQYLDSQKGNSGGSGSGSENGNGAGLTGYDNGDYDPDVVAQAQAFVGASTDGKWGPDSSAKAAEMGYNSLAEVVAAMGGGPGTGNDDYYDQLLGAVSTAKGAYSKQDYATRQQTYQETVAAINDAFNNGMITADQKQSLLRIATPSTR